MDLGIRTATPVFLLLSHPAGLAGRGPRARYTGAAFDGGFFMGLLLS